MNSNNRRQEKKKIINEILRIKESAGIDFLHMPEAELSRWVDYLVRKSKKKK